MSDEFEIYTTPCATCKHSGIPRHKETGEFIVLKEYGRPVGSCRWTPSGPKWWVQHELSKVSYESRRTYATWPMPFKCSAFEEMGQSQDQKECPRQRPAPIVRHLLRDDRDRRRDPRTGEGYEGAAHLMNIWYKAMRPNLKFQHPEEIGDYISEVVVDSESKMTLAIKGTGRVSKRSKTFNYFKDFDDAKKFLFGNLRAAAETAENIAAAAHCDLACACDVFDENMEDQEFDLDPLEDKFYLFKQSQTTQPPGLALLWRPDSSGYTVDINDAGVYDRDEAMKIANGGLYGTFAIPAREAIEAAWVTLEFFKAEKMAVK